MSEGHSEVSHNTCRCAHGPPSTSDEVDAGCCRPAGVQCACPGQRRAAAGQPVSSALVQASGELRVRMDGLVSVTPHQVHLSHSFETHTVLATLNPTPNILGIRAFCAYL